MVELAYAAMIGLFAYGATYFPARARRQSLAATAVAIAVAVTCYLVWREITGLGQATLDSQTSDWADIALRGGLVGGWIMGRWSFRSRDRRRQADATPSPPRGDPLSP